MKKLNTEQVAQIRDMYCPWDKERSLSALAKLFGVVKSTIYKIVKHQSWKSK